MAKEDTLTHDALPVDEMVGATNGVETIAQDQELSEQRKPMNIRIRFVNKSHDMNNSDVVIFSKNDTANFDEMAVAWRVIKNCGRDWSHTFDYPLGFQVGAQDSYGNVSDLKNAVYGQKWDIIRSSSGDILTLDDQTASSPLEVEIKNNLSKGSINAQIYKDDKLFAMQTGVSPGQKSAFSFKPNLWVGVVSQVEEGAVMNSAILSDINTEISLLGILSADLIMTGGGVGPNATPFKFHLVPTS